VRSKKDLNRLSHKFEGQPILNNPGHNIGKKQSRNNRDRNHGIYSNSNPGRNLNRLNNKFGKQPNHNNRDRNHGIYSNSNPGRNLNRLNNKFEKQPNHNNQDLSRENLKEGRKRNRKEGRMTKN
jgi:hypothetical protein